MNANKTLLTALTALLAATTVVACGGRSPSPQYGGGMSKNVEHVTAEDSSGGGDWEAPSAGYGQPGAAADAPPAPQAAPSPPPSQSRSQGWSGDDDGARMGPSHDPFELRRKAERRPGLATRWGEQRNSRVTTAPFVRANRTSPFAIAKLFYNDPQGIAAMSDTLGGSRHHARRFPVSGGHLEMALRDGSGRFMTGFRAGGNNYVSAMSGNRYTIFIKNHSPGRIEAVVSVDGLDVIDGKPASPTKRGYLLDPHGDLEIEGFRTSTSQVAAFRFGSVEKSYAAKKHGSTRNVGVIGLAVFHERGDSPRFWGTPRTHGDVNKRHNANPFPQFATPAD